MSLPDSAPKFPGYKGPYFGALVHEFRDFIRSNRDAEWQKRPEVKGRIREVEYRIDQIHQILLRIYRLQVSETIANNAFKAAREAHMAGRMSANDFNAVASRWGELHSDLNIFTEAFYHFAWQLVLALRDIPLFNGFDPPGVTLMRNKVIAHPSEYIKTLDFNRTYDTGNPDAGPILKMDAATVNGWRDPGMTMNAHELANEISKVLTKHTKKEEFSATGFIVRVITRTSMPKG